jgi:hypothetical protein
MRKEQGSAAVPLFGTAKNNSYDAYGPGNRTASHRFPGTTPARGPMIRGIQLTFGNFLAHLKIRMKRLTILCVSPASFTRKPAHGSTWRSVRIRLRRYGKR